MSDEIIFRRCAIGYDTTHYFVIVHHFKSKDNRECGTLSENVIVNLKYELGYRDLTPEGFASITPMDFSIDKDGNISRAYYIRIAGECPNHRDVHKVGSPCCDIIRDRVKSLGTDLNYIKFNE
jgi:hypothetical protein